MRRNPINWVLVIVIALLLFCCVPLACLSAAGITGGAFAWSGVAVAPAPTATPTVRAVEPAPTAMPTPTPTATSTPTPVPPTATVSVPTSTPTITTAKPEAAVCGVPAQAMKLEKGKVAIPSWGYGPWGQPGVVYPKVSPGGNIGLGCFQAITDFDGRNWQPQGEWTYKLAAGATEVWVTIQGDAPGEVEWRGESLILRSNSTITGKAPEALDNAPKPKTGSTGISIVIYAK